MKNKKLYDDKIYFTMLNVHFSSYFRIETRVILKINAEFSYGDVIIKTCKIHFCIKWLILIYLYSRPTHWNAAVFNNVAANKQGFFLSKTSKISINTFKISRFFLILLDFCFFIFIYLANLDCTLLQKEQ